MPISILPLLLLFYTVNRDSLIQLEHEHRGSRCVIRLREFLTESRSEVARMGVRSLAFLIVVLARVHIGQDGLAVNREV